MSKKYKTKSRFDFNHSRDGKDYIRKSLFDYGTQIVTTDRMEYEVEFLSEERTLGYSRMLWCRSLWIDNKDDLKETIKKIQREPIKPIYRLGLQSHKDLKTKKEKEIINGAEQFARK